MYNYESIQLHISDTKQLVLAELAQWKMFLFYVKLCWENFEMHTIWVTGTGFKAGI
jgi:hypothetical protein